ncbi:hypothetical protein GKZ68_10450 [Hymenobacter sp. BRD128]|uniref:hypothetical protein n=1 Tax=Hymenobacter sp. BRD128 TaxID=2675878 RepID=UPI001562EC1E|nr:hypothetical protein [Hymenobacter sp. BRD128]QKG57010.1 hypothetical protein GKZ68_10450 [Hymenobacter sp. BRD128]
MRDELARFVDSRIPVQVIGGTVVRVDQTRAVCDVQPADDHAPELLDVQLRAVDDGSSKGFVLWPVVGSLVLVGLVENDPNHCVVLQTSRVEAFTLASQTDSLAALLADLLAAIEHLTVTTAVGPSGPPINLPAFQQLAQRAATLFRS